ncbi:DUF3048 domain-containing protein [Aquipuribacter hungaricus]|uniref:DUF3048 domain-containing protein n=2 Tax=Aquipuribacter hungaricus TaxID=545624 RepID=A0ABV7WD84_9MICO
MPPRPDAPPGPAPLRGARAGGHGATRRRSPVAGVVLAEVALGGPAAACGAVRSDAPPPDQPAVTAPGDLPAPVASAPRVGAAAGTNWLTGTDVPAGRVLAVKVDNTASARPQAGLSKADVVYVEEVEGGVTRLLAVFQTEMPGEVGPVRSARTSDILILGRYSSPGFVFSGGNEGVVGELEAADLALVSFDTARDGFVRSPGRETPYDVMGSPGQLLARVPDAGVAVDVGFRFGPAPSGGRDVDSASYSWRAAEIGVAWSAEEDRWLLSMDGRASTAAEGGRLGADTVVFQQVEVVGSPYVDVTGARSPEVRPVGEGEVLVLRDGQAHAGRWSRPAPEDPTTYTTPAGEVLHLDAGRTWVVFTSAGTSPVLD